MSSSLIRFWGTNGGEPSSNILGDDVGLKNKAEVIYWQARYENGLCSKLQAYTIFK